MIKSITSDKTNDKLKSLCCSKKGNRKHANMQIKFLVIFQMSFLELPLFFCFKYWEYSEANRIISANMENVIVKFITHLSS